MCTSHDYLEISVNNNDLTERDKRKDREVAYDCWFACREVT